MNRALRLTIGIEIVSLEKTDIFGSLKRLQNRPISVKTPMSPPLPMNPYSLAKRMARLLERSVISMAFLPLGISVLTSELPISTTPNTISDIKSIEVIPQTLTLKLGDGSETFVVSAIDKDGIRRDVTSDFLLESNDIIERVGIYQIRGKSPGSATLSGTWNNHRIAFTTSVSEETDPAPLSFVRDILPTLSRAGCNGGSCHAKPNGQNSFELSVFAYDPKSDYDEIVSDARGRRIFPAFPPESLILQKATQAVPHKGGKRFEKGSLEYNRISEWIAEGTRYTTPGEAPLSKIQISPGQGRFAPGSRHQFRVEAHYEDGQTRDVTHMADYAVSDKELLAVSTSGGVEFGNQSGQGVVLARYMGHNAQVKVTIPNHHTDGTRTPSDFTETNFIDTLAANHFANLGLSPSARCSDSTFLRRAFLDGVGRLPTIAETREYLDDERPAKRKRWITRILDDPRYGDYWANKWADLLRPNPDRVGVKSVFMLDRWLRQSFRENRPYDQFVREIINHRGSNHGEGPAVIYRDRRVPTELSSMFSQLFLGVRMECAKCHHHPFEKWSQADFYQFAAYFGSLKQKGAGLSPPISAGTEVFYFAPGGSVKHPITDEAMLPKAPDGPVETELNQEPPRQRLAEWLTGSGNPYFSRAIVNRVWANFFSRGFVNPVDDFRDSNPPVNEPLLDGLAEHLVKNGFDLKKLMSAIMNSSLYQLSTNPNESNLNDTKNFSRFYRKRLPAETLLDAISDVTRVPEKFDGMPPGSRAVEAWTYKIESQFLDAFSRPNASSDPPCERDEKSSVVQALHLMHSDNIQSKLSAPKGWVASLASSEKSPREIVEQLYLAVYTRYPSSEERAIAEAAIPETRSARAQGIEDLLWALINTAEFVFNH